jgi:hypothetical protein
MNRRERYTQDIGFFRNSCNHQNVAHNDVALITLIHTAMYKSQHPQWYRAISDASLSQAAEHSDC